VGIGLGVGVGLEVGVGVGLGVGVGVAVGPRIVKVYVTSDMLFARSVALMEILNGEPGTTLNPPELRLEQLG
tara:strand:+ start:408 stop:623 length:216 start_codon:yes stop_codon:yes gene_type:complete